MDRTIRRTIARVVASPAPEPGFMGAGHTAVRVIGMGADFARTDPFIGLMDDRVERPGLPLGEAHPHAGFETVTFMLDGYVQDRDEGPLEAGDVLWMTAGSGVIHNEEVTSTGKVRLLQLWLALPKRVRWAEPRFQRIPRARAPVRREPGVEVRVYSGRSGAARSRTLNHAPVTLADVRLEAGATLVQELPASYNGFLLVLEGAIRVAGAGASAGAGAGEVSVAADEVGWLDRPEAPADGREESVLTINAEGGGARALLYAGEPTGDPIVVQGPFVGDTRQDNTRSYQRYLQGGFLRMSRLTETMPEGRPEGGPGGRLGGGPGKEPAA
jgi:redox-sensitive bicupin YhaK (pirin superfamily)